MGKDPQVERTSKRKRSVTHMGKKRGKGESGVYFKGVKSVRLK